MPELVIRDNRDLEKLKGWKIEGAGLKVEGAVPVIHLHISHLAAEHNVELSFVPSVNLGLSGNIVVADAGITVRPVDIENKGD